MAPPINVQDWYGDRHTCQIASGALVLYLWNWHVFCTFYRLYFYRASAQHSNADARSIHLSVRHVPGLYRNGLTHYHTVFSVWWPDRSSFPDTKLLCEIPTGSLHTGSLNTGGVIFNHLCGKQYKVTPLLWNGNKKSYALIRDNLQ